HSRFAASSLSDRGSAQHPLLLPTATPTSENNPPGRPSMERMPAVSRFSLLRPFALVGASLLTQATLAHPDGPGKWTPSNTSSHWDWRRYSGDPRHGVHMILLPGDGSPYHSRILWWREERSVPVPPYLPAPEFSGGMWGWRDSCSVDRCVGVPSSPCFDT